MDLVALISQAVISGATAVVGDLAGQALKDAYAGVKKLIVDRFGDAVMDEVERTPAKEAARNVLQDALANGDRAAVDELATGARRLLNAIEEQGPSALPPGGISIADIQGMNVRINDLVAEGSIQISKIKGNQDVDIGGLVAGATPPTHAAPPQAATAPVAELRADVRHVAAGRDLHVNIQMAGGERRRLPIAQRLREPLMRQLEACSARDVKYRTAHLMAALLQLEQSFARLCLDEAAPDFAATTVRWIDTFMSRQAGVEQERVYDGVDLGDDPILVDAGRIALSEHAEEVDERHALLAVLRSTTGLRDKIRGELDDAAFARLEETAKSRVPSVRNSNRTDADLFEK